MVMRANFKIEALYRDACLVKGNGAVSSEQVLVFIMKILANEVAKFTCA